MVSAVITIILIVMASRGSPGLSSAEQGHARAASPAPAPWCACISRESDNLEGVPGHRDCRFPPGNADPNRNHTSKQSGTTHTDRLGLSVGVLSTLIVLLFRLLEIRCGETTTPQVCAIRGCDLEHNFSVLSRKLAGAFRRR